MKKFSYKNILQLLQCYHHDILQTNPPHFDPDHPNLSLLSNQFCCQLEVLQISVPHKTSWKVQELYYSHIFQLNMKVQMLVKELMDLQKMMKMMEMLWLLLLMVLQ